MAYTHLRLRLLLRVRMRVSDHALRMQACSCCIYMHERAIQRRDRISSLHGLQSKLKHKQYSREAGLKLWQHDAKQTSEHKATGHKYLGFKRIHRMCAYTCRYDRAYVCIHAETWSRLCVHVRASMIALTCAYTSRHDRAYSWVYAWANVRAYLCVHMQAWLHQSVHIWVDILRALMCAYSCRHDCAYVCAYTPAWLRMCGYVRVSMSAPTLLCAHIGVGMITPMRACMCDNDPWSSPRTHIQACSHSCVHTREGLISLIWTNTLVMIVMMCVYTN